MALRCPRGAPTATTTSRRYAGGSGWWACWRRRGAGAAAPCTSRTRRRRRCSATRRRSPSVECLPVAMIVNTPTSSRPVATAEHPAPPLHRRRRRRQRRRAEPPRAVRRRLRHVERAVHAPQHDGRRAAARQRPAPRGEAGRRRPRVGRAPDDEAREDAARSSRIPHRCQCSTGEALILTAPSTKSAASNARPTCGGSGGRRGGKGGGRRRSARRRIRRGCRPRRRLVGPLRPVRGLSEGGAWKCVAVCWRDVDLKSISRLQRPDRARFASNSSALPTASRSS